MEAAHWFAERGVAAFVLKYKLVPTLTTPQEFSEQIRDLIAHTQANPPSSVEEIAYGPALEDIAQAFDLVASRR